MDQFVAVAKRSNLSTETGLAVQIKGRLIALFINGDKVCAIDDCCPHMGGPLSEGSVHEGIVICPWHAWRFRITDGTWADAPSAGTRVQTYESKVDGDTVYINVNW